MSNMNSTGSCQCGEIVYEVSCEPVVVYACHCTDCQKQSSSAFGISVWIPRQNFELTKGELKFWIATAESGNEKLCGFCQNCGSRIYHAFYDSQDQLSDILSIKGGSFDNARDLRLAGHIWTLSAQGWNDLDQPNLLCFSTEPDDFQVLIDHYQSLVGD